MLLVMVECFSLAMVGEPAAYAQEPQVYEQTAEIFLEDEPAPATLIEAVLQGADMARQLADEAELAALEAEQAALAGDVSGAGGLPAPAGMAGILRFRPAGTECLV